MRSMVNLRPDPGNEEVSPIHILSFTSLQLSFSFGRWGRSGVYAFGPWSGDLRTAEANPRLHRAFKDGVKRPAGPTSGEDSIIKIYRQG